MKAVRSKMISAAVPYVAVLLGLYVLQSAWVAFLLYHLGIAFFMVVGDRGDLLKKICIGWNTVAAVLFVVMPVIIFPVLFYFWKHMQLEGTPLNSIMAGFGLHGASWFLFMIYFSTVQPLLEELYWRGYLGYDNKYISWKDIAFAGYHILVLAWFIKTPWLLAAFIVLMFAAYCWRKVAYKLEGLLVSLLSHIVADVSIVAVINVLMRRF